MKIGDKLRKLREDAGWTLDQMAEELNKIDIEMGLSSNKGMISKWENDKITPTSSYLAAYAKIFKISLNYLLGLTDIPTSLTEKNPTELTEELMHMYRIDTRGMNTEDITELTKELEEYTKFIADRIIKRKNTK